MGWGVGGGGWGVGDGGDGLPYADVGVACGLPPPE